MSAPAVSVDIRFGLPNAGEFIVGTSLVGGTDVVGDGFNDVSDRAEQVQIRRGRWTQLTDVFEAGSLDTSMLNVDRALDPTYVPGPYYGLLHPGRDVRVTVTPVGEDPVTIMQGTIDDWDLAYDVSGRSAAIARATDLLGMLGGAGLDAFTNTATTAGGKLDSVCNRSEVAVPITARSFDDGVETLASDTVADNANVLNTLQLIARSELGYLFASRTNVLTFKERTYPATLSPSATFGGSGIPFVGLSAKVGSDALYARVAVTRAGGTEQIATTAIGLDEWRTTYGTPRTLALSGLLLATDAQALALAESLVNLYDTPRYQISELQVALHDLDAADQATVLAIDIPDVVTVEFTPNSITPAITQNLVVQGIAHDLDAKAGTHVVRLSLIAVPLNLFRVGTSLVGGTDVVAF